MVFTNLQVSLPRNGATPDTAGRSQCSVRLPIEVLRGAYLRGIWQTLSLSATKSDGANINAAANSSFFNVSTSSPQIRVPSGWGTSLNNVRLAATTFDAPSSDAFCKNLLPGGAGLPGIFRANVGVSAQRDNSWDDAIIGTGPADVRLDVQTSWAYCP